MYSQWASASLDISRLEAEGVEPELRTAEETQKALSAAIEEAKSKVHMQNVHVAAAEKSLREAEEELAGKKMFKGSKEKKVDEARAYLEAKQAALASATAPLMDFMGQQEALTSRCELVLPVWGQAAKKVELMSMAFNVTVTI